MMERYPVTIGMPVRNGGQQIRTAIDSLLAQTHKNVRLIISDNCSTDETGEVCREYARIDNRVTLHEQHANLGIFGNFRFVLMQAETPYFLWACHDDVWAPEYVEKNLRNLLQHPEAVASTSRVVMLSPSGHREMSNGTFALQGTKCERLRHFFSDPGEVSRFYSVFDTEALKRSFPADIDVFGYDWIVMALNLLEGDHLELPEVLLTRESHDPEHYHRTLVRQQSRRIYRWLPHWPMTQILRQRLPPEVWRICRGRILRRNVIQSMMYAKYRFPAVAPVVKTLSRLKRMRTASS